MKKKLFFSHGPLGEKKNFPFGRFSKLVILKLSNQDYLSNGGHGRIGTGTTKPRIKNAASKANDHDSSKQQHQTQQTTNTMSDPALLDFNNFSLERFARVQGILQPTDPNALAKHRPAASARRVKPAAPATQPPNRVDFAKKIINSTLGVLDSWKTDQKEAKTANRKYLYESTTLAFAVLYENRNGPSSDQDIEKRHISFVLKLIDAQMVDQAMHEMSILAQHMLQMLGSTASPAASSILLHLPLTSNTSESTANVVVLSQIALLKGLSKYSKQQSKPISSQVSTFVRDGCLVSNLVGRASIYKLAQWPTSMV